MQVFQIEGLRLWFWSGDHEPPHFHLKKSGKWEVKVHFLSGPDDMFEIKWAEKNSASRILRQLRELVAEHRAALLEEWEGLHPN